METPLYTRTSQAWQNLAKPDALDRKAHTLLLLANGRRTLRELSRLLDEDISELAARLADLGYLQDTQALALTEPEDDLA
ncbi:MAG: hypothetical protein KF871_07930 [Hydrogenophaga sp.]|uniref:hypothetical protein n=1 Tax=Hydrogenophaga sp. TaxID=1904254 RepID=UPI001D5A898C|nr:hypothetical protein [Hydrogenophaga sp.]MBX3609813.1 hypothetical protein [Hydrogenophaga sp.]